MYKAILFLTIFFIFIAATTPLIPDKDEKGRFTGLSELNPVSWKSAAWADSNQTQNEIQWFKDEMKISPKYIERQEGIWGMTWAHFFTMVFLSAFGAGTLIVFIVRYRRTKELIKIIKEGKAYGSQD